MYSETPRYINSEVRIQFSYNEKTPDDLLQLNQMLAAMDLTEVSLDDPEVYLAATQEFEHGAVARTTYRCGLNSGVLVCRKSALQEAHRYQIAAEVFEGTDFMRDEGFEQYWHEAYPERKLSTVFAFSFDTHTAFIIIYLEESAR